MKMMILKSATYMLLRHSVRVPRYLSSSEWVEAAFHQPKKYFQISSTRNRASRDTQNAYGVSSKREAKLKIRDNVPEEYELIYKAPMESTIRVWCYPAYCACVAFWPAYMFYYKFYLHKTELQTVSAMEAIHFINPDVEIWIFTAALALFTCAAFSILFRFPFRIYKHKAKEQYVGLFLSAVPLNPHFNHVLFSRATQTKFKNPLYFFMEGSQFTIDEKKAIILPEFFRTPADLCKMLGVK